LQVRHAVWVRREVVGLQAAWVRLEVRWVRVSGVRWCPGCKRRESGGRCFGMPEVEVRREVYWLVGAGSGKECIGRWGSGGR
jgi:hypothetical protein